MMKILNVSAMEILDSRGNPTVEANLMPGLQEFLTCLRNRHYGF